MINLFMYIESKQFPGKSERFGMISQSRFMINMRAILEIHRVLFVCLTIITILVRHGILSNVFAANIVLVNRKEQTRFAKTAFAVFLIKTMCHIITYIFIVWEIYRDGGKLGSIMNSVGPFVVCPICFLASNLCLFAPIMFVCYLGTSLGRHVENFSKLYVDSMFDQFMETTNMDNESVCAMPILKSSARDSISNKSGSSSWMDSLNVFRLFGSISERLSKNIGQKAARAIEHLNAHEYPELSDMKSTKISATTGIKITEAMRCANSQLVRVRLKRTQTMLSELRDMVSDINKMSSPLILFLFVGDAITITTVVTASIQTKLYKSISLGMIPTISSTLGLAIGVVYVCVCLDATSSQLKLLMNKLFDFIVLSNRMQPEGKVPSTMIAAGEGTSGQAQFSWHKEDEAISEIWSQFQYTRKLAGTIKFTIGGILQVSRRLVLVILGHILSAVFIAIEFMSIVDTGKDRTEGFGGSGIVVFHNNTLG